MRNVKVFLQIVILFAIVFQAFPAISGDQCEEVKVLRKTRLSYDIDVRKKRLKIREARTNIDQEINAIEGRLIGLKEAVLASPEEKSDEIWKKYDSLDLKRDALHKKKNGLQSQYGKLNSERLVKRFKMRKGEMTALYECVINNKLTGRLEKIAEETKGNGKSGRAEYEEFYKLLGGRKVLLEAVKKEYDAERKTIDAKLDEVRLNQKRIIEIEKTLDRLELKNDDDYDAIYDSISNFRKKLREYRSRMKPISKRLISLLGEMGRD